jgi:hypothetical protein
MTRATTTGVDALRRPCTVEDERIRLRGRPDELVGIVAMSRAPAPIDGFKIATSDINETEFGYLQRLHYAPLLSSTLPVSHALPRTLSLSAILPPGTTGRVPVRFAVERTTPPGHYEVVFEVGGEPITADVEVLPDEALEIMPAHLALFGPPGGVVEDEVILRNNGNVPIDLDVLGVLVLQEEEQICLSLQRALGQVKSGGEGEAHRVFLDAVVRDLAERKTEFGRVRLADGALTLSPGQAEAVRLAVHLPRDMTSGRRYRALLKARSAKLFVQITAEPGAQTSALQRTRTGSVRRPHKEAP